MNKVPLFHASLVVLLAAALLLGACNGAPTATSAPAQPAALRLAVLPILDALPLYVAQQEGLFAKHNLNVELISVASAPERDQLIAAGQADGMINEALSTMFYNKDQIQVQIVRYARAATAEQALFSIVAAKDSGITSVQDLKGVPIGISQGTIIEYLTNRLLQAEGFQPEEIQTVAVPKIPDRLALLESGELKAGVLPEPATTLAVQKGGVVILDDTLRPELSFSVYTFRKAVIDQSPEALRRFLAAIEEAVQLINADPAKYANVLVEQKIVPPPLAGIFPVPTFVTAGVPTEAQWNDSLAWAKEKGLLTTDVSYADSVNPTFLP